MEGRAGQGRTYNNDFDTDLFLCCRQRRREKVSTTRRTHPEVEYPQRKLMQVKPATQKEKKKVDKHVQQTVKPVVKPVAKPAVQLEEGLSEESELELSELSENLDLSDEEQLYFNVQSQPTATNAQVDEYCRELEARVKKQFEKELEELKKQQMELEVKERVRKEMEKQREQEEVRKRLEEERVLQERLERERQAREEKLQKEEQQTSPRPTPRRRSVKWEKGSFVCYEGERQKRTHIKSQNSVEVQVENKDFVTTSVDQVTQTSSPSMLGLKGETKPHHERVTSRSPPVDKPQAFVPVVAPDVFLGLTFSRDGGQDLQSEASREREVEAKESSKDNGAIEKESARQFISVADIDHELWEKIRSGKETVKQDSVEQEEEEEEVSEDEDEDVEETGQ